MPDSGLNLTAAPRRLKSLDILRAIAILLMIFSGLLPKTLPNWMDHGYQPHFLPDVNGNWQPVPGIEDGNAAFNQNWPAFTWVDLVFPMFLFAMGAAIPSALSRFYDRSQGTWSIFVHALKRLLMLILFAVLVTHLSPAFMKSSVPNVGRLVVVACFLLTFLFFVRWPPGTPIASQRTVSIAALVGILALIVAYAVRNETPFTWSRSDTIILVLAHTYFVSSLIWVLTRRYPGIRFVVLIPFMLMAHYTQFGSDAMADRRWMGSEQFGMLSPILSNIQHALNLPGWLPLLAGKETWNHFVAPLFDFSSLWNFSWYNYLFVVIPGTIVGDWLIAWNNRGSIAATEFETTAGFPKIHRFLVPSVLLLCLALFIGLRHSGYPFMSIGGPFRTPWLALVLGIPALAVVASVVLPTAYGNLWICRRLFYFGSAFLFAGLILACQPNFGTGTGYFEGGISKGPPATLSYYFVSVGLCTLLLMALAGTLDYDRRHGRVSSILEANGQNPLLAYYISHTVLGAVMSLSVFSLMNYPFGREIASIDDYFLHHLLHNPWLVACWAAAKTMIIATIVWIFSINRIYWRA